MIVHEKIATVCRNAPMRSAGAIVNLIGSAGKQRSGAVLELSSRDEGYVFPRSCGGSFSIGFSGPPCSTSPTSASG